MLTFNPDFTSAQVNLNWGGDRFPCPAELFLQVAEAIMTRCYIWRHQWLLSDSNPGPASCKPTIQDYSAFKQLIEFVASILSTVLQWCRSHAICDEWSSLQLTCKFLIKFLVRPIHILDSGQALAQLLKIGIIHWKLVCYFYNKNFTCNH